MTIDLLMELFMKPRVPIYFACFAGWVFFNVRFLMPRHPGDTVRGLSLGMMGGTIAGNMFCVKSIAELIKGSIVNGSAEAWTHPLTYGLIVGAIFFALTNVIFLTKGMKEYEALFMVTVYE